MRQGRQGCPLGQHSPMSQWRTTCPQSLMVFWGRARVLYAGTFVVPRGNTAPSRKTSGRVKPGHVDFLLGHQQISIPLIDAGKCVHHRDRPCRGQGLSWPGKADARPAAPAPRDAVGEGGVWAALQLVSMRVMSVLKQGHLVF
jgi:hypothetical protein